jgi:ATP/maltotriose-dependent transcriptional regulator MalT
MLIESMLAWRGVRDANAAVDPTWRVDLARGIPDAQLLVVRASVAVAEGRADDARDDLLAAAELYTALGMTNPACAPWRAPAALVAFRGGDVAEADRLTSEELESEERFGAKRSLGIALRTRGVVRADLDLLEASVRTLEGSGARLELARSLYEYGSALRRTNHRKDSEPRLHEAHDLARTIDARPLVSKIEDELGALGRPVPSRPVTGVDALTGSERRVVALAASGLSNPEIAQMLFVTRKTVEKHLGNAYLKLGISSRADLPQTIPTGESSLA